MLKLLPAVDNPRPHLDVVAGDEDQGLALGEEEFSRRPRSTVPNSRRVHMLKFERMFAQPLQHLHDVSANVVVLLASKLRNFPATHGPLHVGFNGLTLPEVHRATYYVGKLYARPCG